MSPNRPGARSTSPDSATRSAVRPVPTSPAEPRPRPHVLRFCQDSWPGPAVRQLEDPRIGYLLLARPSIADPDDLAYYLCHRPAGAPLRDLVRVASARWAIQESFQTAKGVVGVHQYQVHRSDGRYRHITLAMLAHAFLTVTRAAAGEIAELDNRPPT